MSSWGWFENQSEMRGIRANNWIRVNNKDRTRSRYDREHGYCPDDYTELCEGRGSRIDTRVESREFESSRDTCDRVYGRRELRKEERR